MVKNVFWKKCCFGTSPAHPLLFAIHATSDFLSVMASSGDVAVRNGSHGINGAHGIKGAHGYSREEIIEVMDELMGMFTQSPVQTQLELLLDQYRSLTTESKKKYHHAAHDKKNPDGSPFFPAFGNDVLTESHTVFRAPLLRLLEHHCSAHMRSFFGGVLVLLGGVW